MSTATRFTRAATVARLLELIARQRAADPSLVPADTIVRRGLPRDPMVGTVIALADLTYIETSVPTMRPSTRSNDDRFELEVLALAWVNGVAEFTEVDELAERAGELVRIVVAEHPLLDLDGDGLAGITGVTLSEADGPNPWYTADGVGSGMRLLLDITARITAT